MRDICLSSLRCIFSIEVREMKKQVLCVAGSLTLVLCGPSSASLVFVDIIVGPNQHPDGLHKTLQIVARFSDAGDQISSVNGLDSPGLNAIHFFTDGGELYNQGLFSGQPLNDFPSVGIGGEAWDSYVTIGSTSFPSNTNFTPNFLGDWGDAPPPVQVILGNAFYEDDGAWFFFGAPPNVSDLEDAEANNETFDIVLVQFTFDIGTYFHLEGNVQWFNPVSGSNNTPFVADQVPSPGALALFGIAGFVGVRRRRR